MNEEDSDEQENVALYYNKEKKFKKEYPIVPNGRIADEHRNRAVASQKTTNKRKK